jgi:hypothetical protein
MVLVISAGNCSLGVQPILIIIIVLLTHLSYCDAVRDCNPGVPNPGIPAFFPIPGLENWPGIAIPRCGTCVSRRAQSRSR